MTCDPRPIRYSPRLVTIIESSARPSLNGCQFPGGCMSQSESGQDSESRRKEVFLALVTAQDGEMPVAQSRKEIAQRFGITEAEVLRIEREGLDNNWPPL